MKPKQFNPNEPYDRVHGDDAHGRAYFQDGAYFNLAGDEVTATDPDPEASDLLGEPADIAAELLETKNTLATVQADLAERDAELADANAEVDRLKLELESVKERVDALEAEKAAAARAVAHKTKAAKAP